MIKIIFVCYGNICRSPMAEYVMKDLAEKEGLSGCLEISSAATSAWEQGQPVYAPAARKLKEHGISCKGHSAHQISKKEYEYYDYVVLMDNFNKHEIMKIIGSDYQNKISMLRDYTDTPGEVADPYFTGDFDTTWEQVCAGCGGLLDFIKEKKGTGF